jgi:uncharacterized protein YlxW (UPF0749 family)
VPASEGATAGLISIGTGAIFAETACWPFLVVSAVILAIMILLAEVFIALAIAIALVVSVFKKVAAATPEKQLEAAEEATNKAAEAADRAAEAYNDLKSSLEELEGKYKALEELTEGTREWEDAV